MAKQQTDHQSPQANINAPQNEPETQAVSLVARICLLLQHHAYLGLGAILIIFLSLTTLNSIITPITQGEDELAHYRYIKFIAQTGRLPIDDQERQQAWYRADWPPLYHLLVGWAVSPLDTTQPHLKDVGESPRRRLAGQIFYPRLIIYTADAAWPWQDGILAWHIGRFISILFSAGALVFTYLTAMELCRGARAQGSRGEKSPLLPCASAPLLALATTALLAFTPRFIFTSSMLGDDSLFILLSASFIWLLLRALRGDDRWGVYIALGLLLGLSIATKYSTGLLPLAIIPLVWWRTQESQSFVLRFRWLGRVALSWAATLLGAGWWFGWIGYYFNTIEEDGFILGLLNGILNTGPDVSMRRIFAFFTGAQFSGLERPAAIEAGSFGEWWLYLFQTFWGTPVLEYDPLFPWAYLVILIICLLAVIGLWQLWRVSDNQTRMTIAILFLIIGLLLPFPILRFFLTRNILETGQGRHILYPAAQASPILLVLGWLAFGHHWSVITAKKHTLPEPHPSIQPSLRSSLLGMLSLFLAGLNDTRVSWGAGQSSIIGNHASRIMHHVSRITFYVLLPPLILLAWSIFQLGYMTAVYPQPLPVQTTTFNPASIAKPLAYNFNDAIKILGYDLQLDPTQPGFYDLTLFWKSLEPVDENYRTQILVTNAQGETALAWFSHPLNGDYPTRAWDKGDVIRDTLPLPLATLPPGKYEIYLNLLYEAADVALLESPLSITTLELADTQPLGDASTLGDYAYHLRFDNPARQRQTLSLVWTSPGEAQDDRPEWALIGPDGMPRQPAAINDRNAIFMVGADWPSGDYALRLVGQGLETEPLLTVANEPRLFDLPDLPETYTPVEANFANQVKLRGYVLPSRRVEPGGGLPLTLYWQGLAPVLGDYVVFDVLLDEGQRVYGGYDRLPREYYSAILWADGEVVEDGFAVPVRADAPPGVYHLRVGLYSLESGEPVSLPLVQAGQVTDATSVIIGPIKVGGPPPDIVTHNPTPQVIVNQSFGDQITLLGYDLSGDRSQPITNLHLTLYWRAEAQLNTDYTTFLHLRDQTGANVKQKDRPPANDRYPTSLWDVGEVIVDDIILPLDSIPLGQYTPVVGLYDFASGNRLPTEGIPENEIRLESLTLP